MGPTYTSSKMPTRKNTPSNKVVTMFFGFLSCKINQMTQLTQKVNILKQIITLGAARSLWSSPCVITFSYFKIFLFRYGSSKADLACAPYEASMPPVFPIGSDGTRSRMTPKLSPNGHPKMNSATNIK